MDRTTELNGLTTFDLAFNLATGVYNEQDKFVVLGIIKSRDSKQPSTSASVESAKNNKGKSKKPPLKGSKAEKILKLHNEGKNPREIGKILEKSKLKAYPAEIYRVIKNYAPEG